MGAWGSGIFEDDFAMDVRGCYRDRLAAKATDAEAQAYTIAQFADSTEESRSVFWIALALCQHDVGRLSDRVQEAALEWIESGRSLAIYQELVDGDAEMTAERADGLMAAAKKLRSPQAKRKAVRGPLPPPTTNYPWRVGGFFGFRGVAHCAVFHVIEIMGPEQLGSDYARVKHPDFVGEPVFAMLHHHGDGLPEQSALPKLRYRVDWQCPPGLLRVAPMLLRRKQFPAERFVDLALTRSPPPLNAFSEHAVMPNWLHFESVVGELNAHSAEFFAEEGTDP